MRATDDASGERGGRPRATVGVAPGAAGESARSATAGRPGAVEARRARHGRRSTVACSAHSPLPDGLRHGHAASSCCAAAGGSARRPGRRPPDGGPTLRATGGSHRRFADLADVLEPGDVLVVNTSAVMPAALDARGPDGDGAPPAPVDRAAGRVLGGRAPAARRAGHRALRGRPPAHAGAARRRAGRAARPPTPPAPRLGGCGWPGSTCPAGCLERTWGPTASPSATPTPTAAWPIEAYQSVFSREPGSAEMPSAARPFTDRLVTELVRPGSRRGSDHAAHRGVVAGGGRAALRRALRGAGGHRHAGQRRPRRRPAGDRGRAPPWCGRWRRPPTQAGRSHPGAGWTELVVRRSGACGWSTGWSPAGTSRSRRTWPCSRPSPAASCWTPRTRRRSTRATAGTSSATAT